MGRPFHSHVGASTWRCQIAGPKRCLLFKVNGQRLKPCIQNLEPGKDVEFVNLTNPVYFFKLVTGTLGSSAHIVRSIPDTGLRSSSLL
jgi:hypothetical protein